MVHKAAAIGGIRSTAGTAFQFASRRIDPETGLYYLRARYYSPSLGRFLQTDPIGTAGGINVYDYVGNDPLNRTDSLGQSPDSPQTAAAAQLGASGSWDSSGEPGPVRLTWNWLTGSGPDKYNFGPGSPNTQETQGAPGVTDAGSFLYNKYNGAPPDGGSVTNYGAPFGLNGYLTAGTLTEQFVGKYTIDIHVNNGQANFVLSNDSSFKSFLYGVGPDWERSSFGPMGNMRQTFSWSEPIGTGGATGQW